jgi:hypothetical protein
MEKEEVTISYELIVRKNETFWNKVKRYIGTWLLDDMTPNTMEGAIIDRYCQIAKKCGFPRSIYDTNEDLRDKPKDEMLITTVGEYLFLFDQFDDSKKTILSERQLFEDELLEYESEVIFLKAQIKSLKEQRSNLLQKALQVHRMNRMED